MSIKANNYEIHSIGFTWELKFGQQHSRLANRKNYGREEWSKPCIIYTGLQDQTQGHQYQTLSNNKKWNDNGFKITSVHLLGEAINNSAIARNATLGKAIGKVVDDQC